MDKLNYAGLEMTQGKLTRNAPASSLLKRTSEAHNDIEYSRKRWIWNLIQNAIDSGATDIELELNKGTLEFRHNGRPFNITDIINIIFQYAQGRCLENTTSDGDVRVRDGTEFLTTYLLSKKLEVESLLQDPAGKTHKKFRMCLDRSELASKCIFQGIQRSINELEIFDTDDESAYDMYGLSKLYTMFKFHLESSKTRQIVKDGIGASHLTIPYILAFNRRLSSITIINNGNKKLYKCVESSHATTNHLTSEYTISENTANELKIVVMSEADVEIAIPLQPRIRGEFKGVKYNISNVFMQLPLVGGEYFDLPFVINSPSFKQNKERSLVCMLESDYINTVRIISMACKLYFYNFLEIIKSVKEKETSQCLAMEKRIKKKTNTRKKTTLQTSDIKDTKTCNVMERLFTQKYKYK